MLTTTQSIFVPILTVIASLLFMAGLNWIHRPFQGAIHVSDYAFVRALQNIQGP